MNTAVACYSVINSAKTVNSFKRLARKSTLNILKKFGYKIVKDLPLISLHEYSSYEEYKEIQVSQNLMRLEKVWADQASLRALSEYLNTAHGKSNSVTGICHGARNGFEVDLFQRLVGTDSQIIGTDISHTAAQYKDLVVWDFHDENPDWVGKFDFVYTNALDQSWKPKAAISTWLNQLKPNGCLVVDMTIEHGPDGANSADPFGVQPEYMPYYLADNFGRTITTEIIRSKKANSGLECWFFIVRNVA